MKVINVSQRSDAWRVWRAQGMSASEAAIIMGRSPYKTPWRLWSEKTGLVLEQALDNNPLIRVGIEAEAKARERFEEQHAVLLLPLCGESERYPCYERRLMVCPKTTNLWRLNVRMRPPFW